MGTFVVGAMVFGVIALAAHEIYRDRKNGKSCGCDCESCSSCPSCAAGDSAKKN